MTDTDTQEPNGATEQRADRAELTNRLAELEAETRRLRRSTDRGRRQQYQATAKALIAVGIACAVAGVVLNSAVLFALAGIGLFSGVLTYYLQPEGVVAGDLSTRVYAATARSYDGLCADLGLSDQRLYVPVDAADASGAVRLFVPQEVGMEPPDATTLTDETVIADDASGHYGLSVQPTGGGLFAACRPTLNGPLGDDPTTVAQQLSETVVESFELAESVATDVDSESGHLSVRISGPVYEHRSGFDHPLVSFFAVGLAVAFERPVEATVTNTDPFSVTLGWKTGADRVDEVAAHKQPAAQPAAGTD